MQPSRRLVLIRHATAEPNSPSGDGGRELTDRGVDEASALGAWLKKNDVVAQLIMCSPAARTRQTWAAIDEASGGGGLIHMEPAIYEATSDGLLGLIRGADEPAATLVVVGHAPGVPQLASDLADRRGNEETWTLLQQGFPPASCAILAWEGEWADLSYGSAGLQAVRLGG